MIALAIFTVASIACALAPTLLVLIFARALQGLGGGGLMTAATMTAFYQALLHNPGGLWDTEVLRDATARVRCTLEDPLMGVPANRSRGLVLAGDEHARIGRLTVERRNFVPLDAVDAHAQCADIPVG